MTDKNLEADYVIVGGGSAGCVLASRLSEDREVSVLLLEAGPSDWNPLIHMPAGFALLIKTGALNWGYETVPQENLGGRCIWWPRGKVLGGSSSINAMVYVRGAPSDYDGWAALGNRGWSYAELLPYFKRAETYSRGANTWRGGDGPLKVQKADVRNPLAKAWIESGMALGYPYAEDFSGESPEGFGPIDATIGDHRRSSAASAYLTPVRDRPNLKIATGALATRVVIENGQARGVVYRQKGGERTAIAAREVVVSGGAINSPQLLMLSGIGDPDALRRLGIASVCALPGVGRNLQDHLSIDVRQAVSQPVSLYESLKPFNSLMAGLQYWLTHTGPVSTSGLETFAWVKTESSLAAPDLQFTVSLALYLDHGREIIQRHGFMAFANMCRPKSRGYVDLISSDPEVAPRIQPNYLSEPYDLEMLKKGIRIARDVIAQSPYDPYRAEELAPGASVQSDVELEEYIRTNADTLYHPVGTCRMGNDESAVVDDELRVRGIGGLRVIDASIMPTLVGGNTNAATIAIAEKGADLVLNRSLSSEPLSVASTVTRPSDVHPA